MQLGVKGQDVLGFDVRDEALSKGRHDVLAKHEPVVGHRRRLAVHLGIFALIPLGEVGDGRDRRRPAAVQRKTPPGVRGGGRQGAPEAVNRTILDQ